MNSVVTEESSSTTNVCLHPLVIINVSDHYTRQKVQQEDASGQPLVIGALVMQQRADVTAELICLQLGIQKGRSVEIFNSFELVSTVVDGSIVVDTDYFRAKREQCTPCYMCHFLVIRLVSTVFKDYDVLGWYSTGSAATTNDVMLLKQVRCNFIPYPTLPIINELINPIVHGI